VAAFITWSDDWLLGIDALDNQHKVLADCINKLVVECRQAEAATTESVEERKERLAGLFNELYTTTKKHFSLEEAFMRHEGYPFYTAHAREHVMLIAELKATFVNSLKEGCSNLNHDILTALKSWLIAHVSHSDRDFANFLLEKHQAHPAAMESEL
jgi:hemerythrin-like metal-binding protein